MFEPIAYSCHEKPTQIIRGSAPQAMDLDFHIALKSFPKPCNWINSFGEFQDIFKSLMAAKLVL